MKKNITLSVLAVSLLASFSVHAADNAQIEVTGVIRPQACKPVLSGNGVVDYGNIPPDSLRPNSYTPLPEKEVSFDINCGAAIKMALSVSDLRAPSAMKEATGKADAGATFGLGTANGAKIGGYLLQLKETMTDGMTGSITISEAVNTGPNGIRMWFNAGDKTQITANRTISWTGRGGTNPAPYKSVHGKIAVSPYLNKPENLPMNEEIWLDGLAILELEYI